MNDPIDQLLHDAGERWRAAQPLPPECDISQLRRRRRWMPLTAAASVILIAAAVAFGATTSTGPPPATPGASRFDGLLVRDGATVRGTGFVKGDRFCAWNATYPAHSNADDCAEFVRVRGLDAVPTGNVQLTGVWRDGVLTVTGQGPAPEPEPWRGDPPVPCDAPPGGWPLPDEPTSNELHSYVNDEHPDRFRLPWRSGKVLVVEVVKGDVAAEQQELRQRYTGNLCVVASPGKKSIADQRHLLAEVEKVLGPIMNDPANGVYGASGGDTMEVMLKMVTPEVIAKFAPVSGLIELKPWLRPVS